MEKIFISADSLLKDSMELARLIVRSGFRPTYLVAMWRGGAPIGIAVQEVLEYHSIHADHIAIRTSSYTGIGEQAKTVRVHATMCSTPDAASMRSCRRCSAVAAATCRGKSALRRSITSRRATAALWCPTTT
jgi:hypoxanthine phosphoribosyltransferase